MAKKKSRRSKRSSAGSSSRSRARSTARSEEPLRRQCASMQVHFRLCDMNPEFRTRQVEIEDFTNRSMLFGLSARRVGPTVIPVVVHVVHRRDEENISDAQIKSQIAVLNKDFRLKNADRTKIPDVWKDLAADSQIEFVLASKDPDGHTTTGVTRTETDRDSFGTGDTVKFDASGGKDAWPADKYLNLWVCTLSGGLLGYAQFPGGPLETDGVVVRNSAFGTKGSAQAPFNKGRTTTHEVGHWLNLRHIWGDTNDCSGSDYVSDTPKAHLPNYGEPSFPHVSCANAPDGDMFMNYMDYVDDAAMVMFTRGQVERMAAALAGPRGSLVGA